jgi:alkanesulfonate monooxygenase SsuD/methylene tetrahydromethanopterin reductase-like flavin-dependent oxidoreductase (luciferase family)
MWISDDRREALDRTRWSAACAANHLDDVARQVTNHGMPAELTSLIDMRRNHYDYYAGHLNSQADHTEYLSDEQVENFAIAGTAAHCAERIGELAALGVTEISSAYLNNEFDQIERVGRAVIPALREISSASGAAARAG